MRCATGMTGGIWRWLSGLSADDHVAQSSLELRAPQVVGGGGGRRYEARTLMGASSSWRCQALTAQHAAGRADGRPGPRGAVRVAGGQPVPQLAGPSVGMVLPRRAQQRGHLCVQPLRTRVRSMAVVPQPLQSRGRVPGQPLVAGLAADPIARSSAREDRPPRSSAMRRPLYPVCTKGASSNSTQRTALRAATRLKPTVLRKTESQ